MHRELNKLKWLIFAYPAKIGDLISNNTSFCIKLTPAECQILRDNNPKRGPMPRKACQSNPHALKYDKLGGKIILTPTSFSSYVSKGRGMQTSIPPKSCQYPQGDSRWHPSHLWHINRGRPTWPVTRQMTSIFPNLLTYVYFHTTSLTY